ncbi:MAG: helix-turn-helix domain-containing protein [Acidimicrobiales bacterium]
MPGTALSAQVREEILIGLDAGDPFAELARVLGRPTSAISREIHRNGGWHAYRAVTAERRAVTRRRRGKLTRFEVSSGFAGIVTEPHPPWQRPSNKAFNGLLRRYVGKGTNLSVYSQTDLVAISYRIYTMSRGIHN